MQPKRIIFHHTADAYQGPQFAKIDVYHRQRGFPRSSLRYFVGYHYLVEIDGKVRKAREPEEIGAHDKDENVGSIGIGLAGNFDTHMPSKAQEIATARLTKVLIDKYKIPLIDLEPHRLNDNTSCPGKNLPDDWLVKNYFKYETEKWRKMVRAIALLFNKIQCIKNSNTKSS